MDIDGNSILTLNGGGQLGVTNGRIVIGDNFNTFFGEASFSGTLNLNAGTFTTDPSAGSKTEVNIGSGEGAIGTVSQSGGSTMITGNWFYIGVGGGNGNYTLTNSTLDTGTTAAPVIALGVNSTVIAGNTNGAFATSLNSTGTLTVTGTSTVNIGNTPGTAGDLQLGALAVTATAATGGIGTIFQEGSSSVNIIGASTMEIGDSVGGTGNYNLEGGSLNIGLTNTDTAAVTVGANSSTGTLTQSTGSTLNALAGTTFTIGNTAGVGGGAYIINGGTANFATAINIKANGALDLNGGQLNIASGNLTGGGTGAQLNLGGGTLNFTSGATFTDSFASSLTGNTSTINASLLTGNLVTFDNALTGAGGINFIGNNNTVFNFASAAGGPTNTYTGQTGITGGTLNAVGADIASSSSLVFGPSTSTNILNLALTTGSLTYAGAISGSGTLNVNFGATTDILSLTNLSNSTSGVNIVLGANIGPNASPLAGTLQVSSGTFGNISELGTGGNDLIIGSGAGTGSVTIGIGSYTGTTTIDANYTLNASSLSSTVTNAGTLNVTGAGGITSAGTAIASNSGTITVTSPAGITGNVTSNAGTLTVTGASGIDGTVASNSGTLNTTIVTGSVTNSGVFTASTAAGTVTGSLTNTGTVMSTSPLPSVQAPTFNIGTTFTSSGTLVVRVNGSVSDEYASVGAANLSGGTIQVQIVGGGKIGMTTYPIVTGSSVDDTGLTLSTPNSALFTYALSPLPPGATTVQNLVVTQASLSSFALTPNESAVAKAIDGTNSSLFNYFGNVSLAAGPTTIPAVLEQLTPESLQYARNIAFENSTFLAERINGIDADLRGGYEGLDTSAISVVSPGFGSGLGRSLGNLLASDDPVFHQTAPNGVNYYPGEAGGSSPSPSSPSAQPTWDSSNQVISTDTTNPYLADVHPGGPQTPRMSEFIGGDVILADLNQDHGSTNAPSSKANYTAGDATAGVSFRMTSHLAAGVLFDYNHTDATTDSSGSKTKIDTYSPGIFATYFEKGFYANGLFSFGLNDYSNNRNTGPFGTASSSPSGQQYVSDLDLGYDFHPDKAWVLGPTLGVTYTHLDIDSFTETGAPGADLSVQSQSADSLRGRLGGHLVYQTNTGDVLLQPNITAMWQHEFLADSSGITSSFSDFTSNPFTIQTAAPSRDSALIGLGLTATLNNSMALYLNYLADVGADDYFAQSVVGGLKARF